jgi:hypothetical protein
VVIGIDNVGDVCVPILGSGRDGRRYVIALSGPLTPEEPADPAIARVRQAIEVPVLVVNELLVRGNLPAATREIKQRMGILS